ncbi:MAG: V-type ATPase, kDa subunit [Gemmatimonadetes bacterium]|nr:V-type ATPase, kDa subunit [Gemmatimonadota bacterium]
MILPMAKLRILGPRARLPATIEALQDTGLLHFAPPAEQSPVRTAPLSPRQARRQRQLGRVLQDVDVALESIGCSAQKGAGIDGSVPSLARHARLALRVRREAQGLTERLARLEEERALIERYRPFFAAFRALEAARGTMPDLIAYHVVLRREQAGALPSLRSALGQILGDTFELYTQALASGEVAALLLVPRSASERIDRLLAETRVQEIPVPHGYGSTLADAIPRMLGRSEQLPGDLAGARAGLEQLSRAQGAALAGTRATIHDQLARYDTLAQAGVTEHAFVIEGWAPQAAEPRLREVLATRLGADVVVEHLGREQWRAEDAPVVLSNPKIFRPFEMLTRVVPLPRYGTMDPTPFVAVFFPMFFGLILGDVGYGLMLATGALAVHYRSKPGTTKRAVARIAGACALFSIAFGIGFGEFFGDLGRRWFGLRPLLFDRGEEVISFLMLALAIGVVHMLLGLVLGAISSARTAHPRAAIGRGLSALMVVVVLIAILAALKALPRAFLTPAVVVVLVTFPIIVILEGIVAPIELFSNFGHILSYARIMALGTSSVMLAIVANQMVGAMGSVVVGALFALLFHLVNFGLSLFTPTIHALRLHYVEFFGTFYSPGGVRYHPLGHWTPKSETTA